MVNLNISSDSGYLFTEPFSPQKLSGKGVGPTNNEKILRAEDLMFIYETIREFWWYNNEGLHWQSSFSSRDKYPSYNSYQMGILRKPDNTSISNSRLAIVNGPGDNPYWFDFNANFYASQSEYTSLPDLYTLFGMTSDKCYHISDLWYNYINTLYSSSSLSSKILTLDAIHRFYKAIPVIHSMYIKVNPTSLSSSVSVTTHTEKHKGGNTIDVQYYRDYHGYETSHVEKFIYPSISDYPSSEQSSDSTSSTISPSSIDDIYTFSGRKQADIDSRELAHQNGTDSQGHPIYQDDGYYTASDVAYSYDYTETEKKINSSTVYFELWPSGGNYELESFKVFAKLRHKLKISKLGQWGSGNIQSYTKYKMVDITSSFTQSTSTSGKICLSSSAIRGSLFKDKMNNVQDNGSMDNPSDPTLPTPPDGSTADNIKDFESKLSLMTMFAVVKPVYHAKYSNEQVIPISQFMV